MKRIYRIIEVSGALIAVIFSATFIFAQSDNISIKRTIGDYYDITISGERNGDYAELQLVQTVTINFPFDNIYPVGLGPQLEIYAYIGYGGDTSHKSTFSTTFQKQIFPSFWSIYYYVVDNNSGFFGGDPVFVKSFMFPTGLFKPDFDEGYIFDLDLPGSTFETMPEGAFKIRNLKVEGYEETPIWATFQWNPRNASFEFVEGGTED